MQCREVNRYRAGCSRQEVQVHRVLGVRTRIEQLGCGTVVVPCGLRVEWIGSM